MQLTTYNYTNEMMYYNNFFESERLGYFTRLQIKIFNVFTYLLTYLNGLSTDRFSKCCQHGNKQSNNVFLQSNKANLNRLCEDGMGGSIG